MSEAEMRLDVKKIRDEREKRAWTQEQLAEVSGLGLRTVQRIETSGVASFESAASLSSALSIPVSELRMNGAAMESRVVGQSLSKIKLSNHIYSLIAALLVAAIVSPPNLLILVMMWSSVWIAFEIGLFVALKRKSA